MFKNFWIIKLWAVVMTASVVVFAKSSPTTLQPFVLGTDSVSQDEIATLAVKQHQAVPLQTVPRLNRAPEVAFLNLYRDKDGLTPQERRELEA